MHPVMCEFIGLFFESKASNPENGKAVLAVEDIETNFNYCENLHNIKSNH